MFSNINMAKLNKKQKKKIRADALKTLESVKTKLNIRTYNSLKSQIEDKRIDAVKRISDNLRDIKTTTKTNISKKQIRSVAEDIKKTRATQLQGLARNLNLRYVKRQSEFSQAGTGNIWSKIKNMKGNVRISLINDGDVIRSFVIDLDKKTGDAYYGLYYDTEYNNLFEEYPGAEVVVTKDAKIRPQRIAQAFKHGITNCLFKPIIEYFEMKETTAQTDGTRLKYKSKVSVSKKLETDYYDTGVPEKDLQFIADKLQVGLKIHLPFNINLVEVTPNKKALTNFEYVNTKLNHIDGFNHNEIVNKKAEQITHEEMTDMYNKLIENDEYFIFKRNHTGVSKISTLKKSYNIKQDFSEFIDEFLIDSNLINCRICDIKDYNLSQYVRAGNHSNQCIDFKPIHYVDDEDNEIDTNGLEQEGGRYCIPYTGYNHIDQEKAYKNVNVSEWWCISIS